jgi:hypothetical protein
LSRYLLFNNHHEGCHEWKIRNTKQSRLTNFFAIPLEKKDLEPNVSSEIGEVTEVTQEESTNSCLRYIQCVKRREFKEKWCKEMKWVSFNHSISVARCEICALFSQLADRNCKGVYRFSAQFKLEIFKKRASFQHLKHTRIDTSSTMYEEV